MCGELSTDHTLGTEYEPRDIQVGGFGLHTHCGPGSEGRNLGRDLAEGTGTRGLHSVRPGSTQERQDHQQQAVPDPEGEEVRLALSMGMGADNWGHQEGLWLASTFYTVLVCFLLLR